MKVTYPGPFDSIEVPALGAVVAQGEAVEVPDEVGEQLTAQGWTPQGGLATVEAGGGIFLLQAMVRASAG